VIVNPVEAIKLIGLGSTSVVLTVYPEASVPVYLLLILIFTPLLIASVEKDALSFKFAGLITILATTEFESSVVLLLVIFNKSVFELV